MSYALPQKSAQAEIEIKKSRFISFAAPVRSRSQAMDYLQQLKQQYPDARHHCWAYVLGDPHCASSAGMGDDGEPSGTAGKPILNVIQHKAIGDIMLVVVRYFGGIKLGAGGLARAYGQAAQAVIEHLPTQRYQPRQVLQVKCDFADEQAVRHLLSQFEGELVDTRYAESVTLDISLPLSAINEFTQQLANLKHSIQLNKPSTDK